MINEQNRASMEAATVAHFTTEVVYTQDWSEMTEEEKVEFLDMHVLVQLNYTGRELLELITGMVDDQIGRANYDSEAEDAK